MRPERLGGGSADRSDASQKPGSVALLELGARAFRRFIRRAVQLLKQVQQSRVKHVGDLAFGVLRRRHLFVR